MNVITISNSYHLRHRRHRGRFFYDFLVCFRTLEAFWERRFRLIILATLQWLQLLPWDEKCF